MQDNKNLIIAFVLSLVILVAFDHFYMGPSRDAQLAAQKAAAEHAAVTKPAAAPGASGPVPEAAEAGGVLTRAEALARSPRIAVHTPKLSGSIALQGARLDDLTLTNYKVTLDKDSPDVTLLSPAGSDGAYFADFGWATAGSAVAVPDATTLWTADSTELTPAKPVTLSWTSPEGLLFTRKISVDDDYMFTVVQRVQNTGDKTVSLTPYGLISRHGTPVTADMMVLHEGAIGVFGETLVEEKYKSWRKDGRIAHSGQGGWLGMTDKYWMTALVPDQSKTFDGRFSYTKKDDQDRWQSDYKMPAETLAPGGSIEATSHLFSGAKVVSILENYQDKLSISRFKDGVDWGWYPWLTKPIFMLLHFFHNIFGNFGVSILALTVLIKLAFFPLANKSYEAMGRMKQMQPKMKALQERYKEDKPRLQQEMMELYKKEKLNPMAGCLPILVQIPVFFALYKVIYVTIEMRHAPFFGWVHDLSAPDPMVLTTLFGLIPWNPPHMLAIGIWPLIMGLTMFLQQKLNPAPTDPVQAQIMKFLPLIFIFILAPFPVGLVIYWTWNNTLSILQQWVIQKRVAARAAA
ncbi:membrane protein insertase YidC [Govanella unica]|uniref:Membrane protein insertase YidC n=1 Tax=Govanella unica TaxID=2975056 RepID=A0A9X3TWB5_9PROT|nr:membrane protein insertase YidC [Govania unica]MDA5192943.1 membrane protein insertase YidC [Govania unica]